MTDLLWTPWPEETDPGRSAELDNWCLTVEPAQDGWHWEASLGSVVGPYLDSWTVLADGHAYTLEDGQAQATRAIKDQERLWR